jgi:hypothetical protein
MEGLLFLDEEINRRLKTLPLPDTRLSLLSVTAATVRFAILRAAVAAASASSDTVGTLVDGSIGVLALRYRMTESEAAIEHRFLPLLKTALLSSMHRRADNEINLRFRAIHRRASELHGPHELVHALLVTPARQIRVLGPPTEARALRYGVG